MQRLEGMLNYKFKNKALLKEALTHRSCKLEINNERLEFLGDAVLDLIVGEYLFTKFRHNGEGELSKLRAALVNEESFFKIASLVNLGSFVSMSISEERNGGREKHSIISDALEAVMGAIYLESGVAKVREIFIPLLEKSFAKIDLKTLSKDYKTALQEFTQEHFGLMPRYELVRAFGPDHNKTFEIAAFLEDRKMACEIGKSKKEAEQLAAKKMLALLKAQTFGRPEFF